MKRPAETTPAGLHPLVIGAPSANDLCASCAGPRPRGLVGETVQGRDKLRKVSHASETVQGRSAYMTDDDVKLEPCPFCKEPLRLHTYNRRANGELVYRLTCTGNYDCFFMDFADKAEAVEMGNRRPNSSPPDGRLREALEAAERAMARHFGPHNQTLNLVRAALRPVFEEHCPGHVASDEDPKICGRCGIHIDTEREPVHNPDSPKPLSDEPKDSR